MKIHKFLRVKMLLVFQSYTEILIIDFPTIILLEFLAYAYALTQTQIKVNTMNVDIQLS